jgi:hypothetical protein
MLFWWCANNYIHLAHFAETKKKNIDYIMHVQERTATIINFLFGLYIFIKNIGYYAIISLYNLLIYTRIYPSVIYKLYISCDHIFSRYQDYFVTIMQNMSKDDMLIFTSRYFGKSNEGYICIVVRY